MQAQLLARMVQVLQTESREATTTQLLMTDEAT